jgi:hypothetical protein
MWRARNRRVRWRIHRFPDGPQSGSRNHHVSTSLPAIPDGRISRVRFWPWSYPTVVFPGERSLSADSRTPNSTQFTSRDVPLFTDPTCCSSGYSWNHQVPRAPSHVQGVTSHVVASRTTSAGVTPPSSLPQAHAPVLYPLAASVSPLHGGSLPVAVSPGWEKDLPDVSSANLSLRAWTPTPAALVVHLPVPSHKTTAFPTLGPGRRLAISIRQLQHGLYFGAAVIH